MSLGSGLNLCALIVVVMYAVKFDPADAVCRTGWTSFENHCYRYFLLPPAQPSSFSDAVSFCGQKKAELLEVSSQEENDFVTSLINGKPIGIEVWLAIIDRVKEGRWTSFSSTQSITYTNWSPGEPDNSGLEHNETEDCAVLKRENGLWDDVGCDSTHDVVCESTY